MTRPSGFCQVLLGYARITKVIILSSWSNLRTHSEPREALLLRHGVNESWRGLRVASADGIMRALEE
jgi:hypothetical protein